MRSECVVCGDILFKRIRCFEDGPNYMHHKDVPVPDDTFDSHPDYHVVQLHCVTCGLLYNHDER